MKRLLILIAVTLCALAPVMAQKHKDKSKEEMRRELREFKMKFLAQEIDLKEDQREMFTKTYDEMSAERHKTHRTVRSLQKQMKEDKNLSDEDYARINEALTNAKEQETAIEKKYDAKFAKFLTPKQIFKLKEAEEAWRARMRSMAPKHRK